ncbi:MAG TPA: hybrid sensor histidine kinase/response regulator, partial [Polyangiales bacterium]|nr:hybrid sensor histidine kinase/response regulator [Polyangiales bacterium]
GLATVFTVTQRMGAHIHIDSEVDRGTCVTVCFPKNDGQEVFREIEPTATLRGTVLLVEDDPMVCSTLERFLASFGLEVFATTNPNEAVEICNQAPRIDLVVSDVMMPKMLGPVLVEKLRLKRPDVPVLYISAHGRRDLIDRGILKQGEALLTKPFESRDLHSRLVKLMPSSLD